MQSGIDRELKAIGRLHSAREALESAEAVKKAGIPHLSLDLMYALPHQSLASFRESLRMAAESGADHLSAYCLTLSDEAPLSQVAFPQADEEEQQQMYLEACRFLEEKGLLRYEISNFARSGCESRHNLKYWLRHPTLGFGAAAWSFMENRRWAIVSDLEQVIGGDYFSLIEEEEVLGPEDALSETVMLSLRLRRGLSFSSLSSLASPEAVREKETLIRKKLPALLQAGLAERTENGFCLTHRGAFVSNAILADLI
jgi:oxygen-independent coproporphyrinogen-3 oxidase